jgi:hypothetical protein
MKNYCFLNVNNIAGKDPMMVGKKLGAMMNNLLTLNNLPIFGPNT